MLLISAVFIVAQAAGGGLPPSNCTGAPLGIRTIDVPDPTGGVEPETYRIWGPSQPCTKRPLLVLFHSGATATRYDEYDNPDTWDDYDIITEAVDRGWFVLMHDGGMVPCHGYSTYGNEAFQRHTEAVIADALSRHKISRNKIYGYGFSSGAGEALAYAARHRDPKGDGGYFAAVISASGHVAEPLKGALSGNYIGGCIFGSSYCNSPFAWQRASILDAEIEVHSTLNCGDPNWMGPLTVDDIDYWTSQAHNIGYLPVQMFYSDGETGNTLQEVNQYYELWLNTHYPPSVDRIHEFDCVAGSPCASTPPDCDPAPPSTPGTAPHQWDTVCADLALDYFTGKTRSGHLRGLDHGVLLCAESNRRYDHFTPTLTSIDGNGNVTDFGRIVWSIPSENEVAFAKATGVATSADRAHNLATIRIHTDGFTPFDTTSGVFAVHTTYPVQIVVEGYSSAPLAIYGTDALTQVTWLLLLGNDYTWDAGAQTITFNAPAGSYAWSIVATP